MTDEAFFSLLLRIMFDTRQNKRYGRDAMQFETNWAPLLIRFMRSLNDRTFRILHNYTFLVSIPKWREIFATYFEGRMADHLICDILKPYIEQELHPRTFNNREGMGSMAAINQVIEDIMEVSQCDTQTAWVIKFDMKGFFPNASCDYMYYCFDSVINKYSSQIAADYADNEMPAFLRWLAMISIHCCPTKHCERRTPEYLWKEHINPEKSLFSKPDAIGAPIGRMVSQTGMGLYINDEVRWLNDECGIRTTVFMDDGVMVVPDRLKDYALSLLPELRRRLADKGVAMNDKKFYCQQHWKGLEFLGSHIHSNRIILNDGTFNRCLERIKEYNAILDDEKYFRLDKFISTVNSYTGLLKNRTSYRRCLACRDTIADAWWQWIEWDDRRLCVVSKPEHSKRARLNRKYHLKLKNL